MGGLRSQPRILQAAQVATHFQPHNDIQKITIGVEKHS